MIAYRITDEELRNRIEAHNPTWSARAVNETRNNANAGRHISHKPGLWSEIKSVFLDLQGAKCAYCERLLESPQFGSIEHDIEHYRPKGAIEAWPPNSAEIEYEFDTGGGSEFGYYLLAYDPRNYATACKTCNSRLKASFFPIEGRRAVSVKEHELLRKEKPLLLFPLGEHDPHDPEDLIVFDGPIAAPRYKSGPRFRRARVTIDVLQLNRDSLIRDRCQILCHVYLAHLAAAKNPAISAVSLANLTNHRAAFTSCARAFDRLVRQNPGKAKLLANQALRIESLNVL